MTGYSAVSSTPPPTPVASPYLPMGRRKEPSTPRRSFSPWVLDTEVDRRELSARAEMEIQRTKAATIIVSFFISTSPGARPGAPCARAIARLVVERVRTHERGLQRAQVLGTAASAPCIAPVSLAANMS